MIWVLGISALLAIFAVWGVISFLFNIRSDIRSLHYILNFSPFAKSAERREVGLFSENYLSVDEIPSALVYGILLTEDEAFFFHKGWMREAKSIHQKLVSKLFMSSLPSSLRNLMEIPYAMILDREFSKKETLGLYLSSLEWGDGIVGIRAAAEHYFKKSPSNLQFEECAYLASIVIQPSFFDREFKSQNPFSLEHANRIARAMTQLLLMNPSFEKNDFKGIDPLLSHERLYEVLRVINRSGGVGERKRRAELQASLLLTRFSALYLKPVLIRPNRRKAPEASSFLN